MQNVSNEYKESMKSLLRERGHILVNFGVVNQDAQRNASFSAVSSSPLSNTSEIFTNRKDRVVYATLEQNFHKLDGSMLYLGANSDNFNDSYISGHLISTSYASFEINFPYAVDLKGLSIDFGPDSYPRRFYVTTDTNQTIPVLANDRSLWSTDEELNGISKITVVVYEMSKHNTRLRVYSVSMGVGLIYTNDVILDSSLETVISPTGEELPQTDFYVTLTNYDGYFDIDNPHSLFSYIETGQEMDIQYGYQLPNSEEIEWVQGGHLYCTDWESDNKSATIRCADIFRNMNGEYYKGAVSSNTNQTYYDLAEEVLRDAGITNYVLNNALSAYKVSAPIPKVTHKEALQLIANACGCTMTQDRYGVIRFLSTDSPSISATSTNSAAWSNVSRVGTNDRKNHFATMSKDYVRVNGELLFTDGYNQGNGTGGYVSNVQSNASGTFTTNPVLTVALSSTSPKEYGAIKFRFGLSLPSEYIVRTYNESGTLLKTYNVTSSDKEYVLQDAFSDLSKIEMEFVKTKVPYNRIEVDYVEFVDVYDFTFEEIDILQYPTMIKTERVREVVVPYYTYQKTNNVDTLVSDTVVARNGARETFFLDSASYNYSATLGGSASNVSIVSSGAFHVTVEYKTSGELELEIKGNVYKVIERECKYVFDFKGKSVRWENPLVDNYETAQHLVEWLADHYYQTVEYEYSTRGNPELDTLDKVHQFSRYEDDMKVLVTRTRLDFKQAFSGSVTTRKIQQMPLG